MAINLHIGDCLEVMREMPDKSVDAVVTDPPYGTTDISFDKTRCIDPDWHTELLRIVKDDGYFAALDSVEHLGEYAKIWSYRWYGVWIKGMPLRLPYNAKKPNPQCEFYGVFAHPFHKVKNLTYNKLYTEGTPYKRKKKKGKMAKGRNDQIARNDTSAWTKDGYEVKNNGTREVPNIIYAPNKMHTETSQSDKNFD